MEVILTDLEHVHSTGGEDCNYSIWYTGLERSINTATRRKIVVPEALQRHQVTRSTLTARVLCSIECSGISS
jgi:hypothetical protein